MAVEKTENTSLLSDREIWENKALFSFDIFTDVQENHKRQEVHR